MAAPLHANPQLVAEMHGVKKRFGELWALDGLDLDIRRAEVVGLVGPNGAGKTTTIEVMLGMQRATAGSVRVLGLDPQRDGMAVRARTAYLMQRPSLDRALTGYQNLTIFAALYGIGSRQRNRRVQEVLDWTGLTAAAKRPVRTYSGGMERRLDLAVNLLPSPELAILDEPTLGLDVEARHQIWDLVGNLRSTGISVLITTHYLDEAANLCDRVAVISAGKRVAQGSPTELQRALVGDRYRLTIRYAGEVGTGSIVGDSGSVHIGSPEAGVIVVEGTEGGVWAVMRSIAGLPSVSITSVDYQQPTLDDVVLAVAERQRQQLHREGAGDG